MMTTFMLVCLAGYAGYALASVTMKRTAHSQ